MLFENLKACLSQNPKLSYDEACIDINNTLSDIVTIFDQYDECHNCNFQNVATILPYNTTSIVAKTTSPIQLYYMVNNTDQCHFPRLLFEHYRYGWNITEHCSPMYVKESADDAYLPILMAFVVLFCFGTIWYMVKWIYKRSGRLRNLLVWSSEIEEDLGGSTSGTPLVIERTPTKIRKHPNRIKSVDIFRGLCIMLMIFVNYEGGKYWFFRHSTWNGLTIADLVFPWFLWLMGLSFNISLQSKLRRAVPRRSIIFHVVNRTFILILLGIILNSNKNMSTIADLRFPGVLQRIGITYLIVGLLESIFTKRSDVESVSAVHDIVTVWPQWLFVVLMIVIHTCVTFLVDVPGCGKGYLGPGGLDDGGKHFNCTGGVAGYIDRSVFGNHMYKNATCIKVYQNTVYFDPEGILGILTSIVTVYLGVQAGKILNTYQNVKSRIVRWTAWGLITGIIGGSLCSFSRDDGPIPINKQLWSLSYTFVTAGMAFIIHAGLFLIVDILRKWGGRPFFYPGMNAIFLYVGHELMKNTFPFGWKPTEQSHATFLFMNLWGTFLWVAISIFLYKRNIFFKI